MNRTNYKIKLVESVVKFFDIFLFCFIFISIQENYNTSNLFNIQTIFNTQFVLWDFIRFFIMAFCWNRAFVFMRMYQIRVTENEKWSERLVRTIVALSISTIIVLGIGYTMGVIKSVDSFYYIFFFTIIPVFMLYRSIFFVFISLSRIHCPKQCRALIVGQNDRSMTLLKSLKLKNTGYTFIGFVDDIVNNNTAEDKGKKMPVLCSLDEFGNYISNYPVDEVFLTLPLRSYYDELYKIIKACITQGIKVSLVNDLFDFHIGSSRYDVNLESSFIAYDVINRSILQHDLKRIFDIVVSLTALAILIPVFALVSLILIIQDGFPVIYIQKRIGTNKRRFNMFKFRSMVVNADKMQDKLEEMNEVKGAAFKITNDPRITKFGAFLRKTSLDEIPQFLNVLMGSMSIVGPRPLPVRDFKLFYKDTHRRRFSVKPGITGLWQVSGRSEIEFEEWMRLDLHYIDNWNLWFDIKLFLKTIVVVLAGSGAK